MAGNQPTLLLKSQNNINLYKKFNSQLNLTKIFAKYAYWLDSPQLSLSLAQLSPSLSFLSVTKLFSLNIQHSQLFATIYMSGCEVGHWDIIIWVGRGKL